MKTSKFGHWMFAVWMFGEHSLLASLVALPFILVYFVLTALLILCCIPLFVISFADFWVLERLDRRALRKRQPQRIHNVSTQLEDQTVALEQKLKKRRWL